MSYELTKWAIQEVEIPQTSHDVLIAICSYCDANFVAFPSQALIAKCARVDEKTATRAIKKLVEMGLIEVVKRGVYRVNKVEPIITQGDGKSPKVTNNHYNKGDGKSPKSDFKSPEGDGKSPPYNKPINKPITNQKIKNRFQEFWEKYPVSRREGKTKTETSYRVVIEKISEDDLHRALDAQLQYWEKEKTEDRFKKYILRWLRDEAYAKFLAQPKNNHAELIKAIQAADRGMRWNDARYGMTLNEARLLVNQKKCEAA